MSRSAQFTEISWVPDLKDGEVPHKYYSDVYISHNCCCASLLCIFVFCRAVRYSFDHINRVLMEIWVKIKQLISILFCGYRRRMPTTIADASRNLYSPGAQVPQRVIIIKFYKICFVYISYIMHRLLICPPDASSPAL